MANVTISKFSDGTNTGYIASQAYFECSTAAATAAKTATSPDSVLFSNTSLSRGTTVFVKFTNENTADNPTLQIGTSTAKSISGSATWSAGSVVSFTYDGTNWIQGSGDSSSGDVPVMLVTANYTYEGGGHYTFTGYSVTGPTVSELYNYTQTSGNRTINFNFADQGEFGDIDAVSACTGEISYFNYDTPPTAVTINAHLPGFGVYGSDFSVYLTNDASTTTVTKTTYSSVTSISSSSTDSQYPTAKAVYDLVNSSGSVLNVISGTTTWGQVIDAYTANKSIIYKTQGTDPQLNRIYQLSLYNATVMGSTVGGTLVFTSLGSVSYNSNTVPGYVELKWTLTNGTRSSVISYSDATQTVVPLVNLDNVAY